MRSNFQMSRYILVHSRVKHSLLLKHWHSLNPHLLWLCKLMMKLIWIKSLFWNFILVPESWGIMLLSFGTDQEIWHASLNICVGWGSVSYRWGLNVLVRPRTKLSSHSLFHDCSYISGKSVLHKLYLFRRLEEASSSDFSIIMARMNHKTWFYRYMPFDMWA